jgi:hypothetical protein
MQPFITFYTPTYKRPQALARCLASVASQTVVGEIEQIVIPDHVGVGIHGMYARVPQYASAVHGEYVMFLCDDDVLADATVVETVKTFAGRHEEGTEHLPGRQSMAAAVRVDRPELRDRPLGRVDAARGIVRSPVRRRLGLHAGVASRRRGAAVV